MQRMQNSRVAASGRRRLRACRAAALLCVTLLLCGQALAQGEAELSGQALVAALRAGGYNIYFRHAATDWSQQDQVEKAGDWTSCDGGRMRQLSQEGRATARAVGAAIRRLSIPVGRVLASEYCRTAETARLMGLGAVETTTVVMNMRAASFVGGRAAVVERARRRIAEPPAPGTNTILVAHGNLLNAAADVYVGEAGAAVFAPDAADGFELVALLEPEDWTELAERLRTTR